MRTEDTVANAGDHRSEDCKRIWASPKVTLLPIPDTENTGVHSPTDTGDHTFFNFHS